MCSVAGLRLCLDLDFRPGDSSSSSGWIEMMERLFSRLLSDKKPFLNRADVAFCSEEFLQWHESEIDRPRYLFKLRKTSRIKEAISQVREDSWQGVASFGALQVAETRLKLHGWNCERRIVLGRRLISKQSPQESGTLFGTCQYEYYAWVTNLSTSQFDAFQIAELYQQRADCENIFDELKSQWGLSGFCSQQAHVTEIAERLTLLSYNLWSLFVRFFSGTSHQKAKTSRKDYLLHASQLVETARGKILKMTVSDELWKKNSEGYNRLLVWLKATVLQLKLKSDWGRAFVNTFPDQNTKFLSLN